ncbi:unnamed protein product [Arabidopsis lyrata]|nr:unnamed protein product [Arabidopsis lyrata]
MVPLSAPSLTRLFAASLPPHVISRCRRFLNPSCIYVKDRLDLSPVFLHHRPVVSFSALSLLFATSQHSLHIDIPTYRPDEEKKKLDCYKKR